MWYVCGRRVPCVSKRGGCTDCKATRVAINCGRPSSAAANAAAAQSVVVVAVVVVVGLKSL